MVEQNRNETIALGVFLVLVLGIGFFFLSNSPSTGLVGGGAIGGPKDPPGTGTGVPTLLNCPTMSGVACYAFGRGRSVSTSGAADNSDSSVAMDLAEADCVAQYDACVVSQKEEKLTQLDLCSDAGCRFRATTNNHLCVFKGCAHMTVNQICSYGPDQFGPDGKLKENAVGTCYPAAGDGASSPETPLWLCEFNGDYDAGKTTGEYTCVQ